MRIILWSSGFLKGHGGAERVVAELANLCARDGAQIWIAADSSMTGDGDVGTELKYDLDPAVSLAAYPFPNPLESFLFSGSFFGSIFQYLLSGWRFAAFVRRERIQIMHLHFVNIDALLLVILKRLIGFKFVITFTGTELELAAKSRLSAGKLKLAIKSADIITTVSREIGVRLESEFGATNTIHITNGIDPAINGDSELQTDSTLLDVAKPDQFMFVGRFHPVKRVPDLVRTFIECLKRGRTDRILYLVGEGIQEPSIREVIRREDMEDRIILLGPADHGLVLSLLSEARALILNSESEACPLVILEAMSQGTAIIAPDVGGIGELVSDGKDGLLFERGNDVQLQAAIERLSSDSELAQKLGGSGLKKAADFPTVHEAVSRYLILYDGPVASNLIAENSHATPRVVTTGADR